MERTESLNAKGKGGVAFDTWLIFHPDCQEDHVALLGAPHPRPASPGRAQ